MTTKGPGSARSYEAKDLRIGIVHSRWNSTVIEALVSGAKSSLQKAGVPPSNIVTQSVPGSYELPWAVQRMYTASQTTAAGSLVSAATDLLSVGSTSDLTATNSSSADGTSKEATTGGPGGPLDAIIAIGVLIKGSTMHFEYIADSVSHGLMKVQLDSGCPVIFGLLTCLNEEQAHTRAGLKKPEAGKDKEVAYGEQGHNHGEDWGSAAVEMAAKRRAWGEGKFLD